MKKLNILALVTLVCVACNEKNVPVQGGGTTPTQENASCSFTYKVDGLKVEFKNTSKGDMLHYTWDLGDGNLVYDENPTWTYEMSGTYKVTLKGVTRLNNEYSQTQTITVKSKVEEYIITGYKLYSIPYTNKYYLWMCEGTKPNGEEDFFFNTVYTPKLTNSSIPYTYYFVHPVLLEDIHSYSFYTIIVEYCATQDYEGGTQCLKQKLFVSDILKKKNEYIITSDNGKTKIGILMEYR